MNKNYVSIILIIIKYYVNIVNIRQEIMEENQTNIERAQTEKDMWE